MADGYQVLSQVSGLPQSEIKSIWEQVKVNHKTLDECAGPHEFTRPPEASFGAKYTCNKCGGTVDGTDKLWYERGLAHGRQYP